MLKSASMCGLSTQKAGWSAAHRASPLLPWPLTHPLSTTENPAVQFRLLLLPTQLLLWVQLRWESVCLLFLWLCLHPAVCWRPPWTIFLCRSGAATHLVSLQHFFIPEERTRSQMWDLGNPCFVGTWDQWSSVDPQSHALHWRPFLCPGHTALQGRHTELSAPVGGAQQWPLFWSHPFLSPQIPALAFSIVSRCWWDGDGPLPVRTHSDQTCWP